MDNKLKRIPQDDVDEKLAHKLIDAFGGDVPLNPESARRRLSKMGIKNQIQQSKVYQLSLMLVSLQ